MSYQLRYPDSIPPNTSLKTYRPLPAKSHCARAPGAADTGDRCPQSELRSACVTSSDSADQPFLAATKTRPREDMKTPREGMKTRPKESVVARCRSDSKAPRRRSCAVLLDFASCVFGTSVDKVVRGNGQWAARR